MGCFTSFPSKISSFSSVGYLSRWQRDRYVSPQLGIRKSPAPVHCGRATHAAHCPPCVRRELGIHGRLAGRGPRLLSWSVSWSVRSISVPQGSVVKNLKFTDTLEEESGERVFSFALLTLCHVPVLSPVC